MSDFVNLGIRVGVLCPLNFAQNIDWAQEWIKNAPKKEKAQRKPEDPFLVALYDFITYHNVIARPKVRKRFAFGKLFVNIIDCVHRASV